MKLATMRFAGYEWRYNPLTLKITHELSHKKRVQPTRGEVVAEPYVKVAVISGKGELSGEDCLEQCWEIEKIYRKGKAQVLTLPGRAPMTAYFTHFAVQATDTPDLITYSFEFTQADTQSALAKEQYHTGNEWDSLYSIARDYEVTVEKLVELNPWIKRPDEQLAGKKVRLC